ncbi:MAG TPA: SIS domain-containing protein [Parachlamydiaceae bacterium]|nr:SIS domain-containing protein [Parachlamydiaceae bacterium]
MSVHNVFDGYFVLGLEMQRYLLKSVSDAIDAVSQLQQPNSLAFMEEAANMLTNCFKAGNKVIIAGNGGSLCDGAHFAEELTGVFRAIRPALPAISLSEPGHITCVGNDLGFDWVFARGVEAFGKPGDIFVGLTTSGNSANIVNAFETAERLEMQSMAFLGKTGGKLKGVADIELLIEGFATSDRIQEAHMAAIHIIIEMVEHLMFSHKVASTGDSLLIN